MRMRQAWGEFLCREVDWSNKRRYWQGTRKGSVVLSVSNSAILGVAFTFPAGMGQVKDLLFSCTRMHVK